jgi:uncharacterized protein with HEPN domain
MSNAYDRDRLLERLNAILTALKKIPRRFASISEPNDFLSSEEGGDRMDAICMILLAVGEACKVIDRQTDGQLFAQYPEIQWRGVMGLRDVIAHEYFDIDVEQLYAICKIFPV